MPRPLRKIQQLEAAVLPATPSCFQRGGQYEIALLPPSPARLCPLACRARMGSLERTNFAQRSCLV